MRRPFKQFVQTPGVFSQSGFPARPGHMADAPTRRPHRELVQIGPGDGEPYVTHRYYSATGRELWRADHGSRVNAVAIADDGSCYTVGEATDSHNPSNKCLRLAKWATTGSKKWGIKANGRGAYDVSIDSDGNIWIAAGLYLEKYSPSGALLLQLSPIPDPWQYMPDGIHFYSTYFDLVTRVLCSTAGPVFFGTNYTEFPKLGEEVLPAPILSGNSCDLNGSTQRVYYNNFNNLGPTFEGKVRVSSGFYSQDDSGNIYNALVGNVDTLIDLSVGYSQYHNVVSATGFYEGILRPPDEPMVHGIVGLTQADRTNMDQSQIHRWGSSAICVHKPTNRVLISWGVDGFGEIKSFVFTLPYPGLPYIESQPTIVTESSAGYKGVLRCNDSLRYVYGINNPNGSPGCTHRIRDYPSDLVWEGNHKGTVYDARITNTGRVLVGGDRVYDP